MFLWPISVSVCFVIFYLANLDYGYDPITLHPNTQYKVVQNHELLKEPRDELLYALLLVRLNYEENKRKCNNYYAQRGH